jgi:RNA polymerase sigma-70 factor (ECF subfamily)
LTEPEAIERFQALYAQEHGRVYAYAVSRAGRQLADEVVNEVFLIAWRRLADVPAPPLPWLLAVARNVVIGQFRASARQQSLAAELRSWVTQAELAAGDIAEEVAERISVLAALARLPDADRELLTLVAWHGLAPGEAAQVVGCSKAAYFVRLHRARRRLERAMAGPPEAGAPAQPGRSAVAPAVTGQRAVAPAVTGQRAVAPAVTGRSAVAPAVTGQRAAAPAAPARPALISQKERML